MEAGISPQTVLQPDGRMPWRTTRVVTKWFCLEDSAEAECLRTPGMERLYLDRQGIFHNSTSAAVVRDGLQPASPADGSIRRFRRQWPACGHVDLGWQVVDTAVPRHQPRGPFRIGDGLRCRRAADPPVRWSTRTCLPEHPLPLGYVDLEWNHWTAVSPGTTPPGRAFFGIASDAESGPVLIYGGQQPTNPIFFEVLADAWSWSSQPQH